jgi:hypothetical protein
MFKILFDDKEYVFVGGSLNKGGAITTQDDYENGRCSFAHLCEDGKILRFNSQIGTIDDITIIGEVKPNVSINSLLGMFTDPSWPDV